MNTQASKDVEQAEKEFSETVGTVYVFLRWNGIKSDAIKDFLHNQLDLICDNAETSLKKENQK